MDLEVLESPGKSWRNACHPTCSIWCRTRSAPCSWRPEASCCSSATAASAWSSAAGRPGSRRGAAVKPPAEGGKGRRVSWGRRSVNVSRAELSRAHLSGADERQQHGGQDDPFLKSPHHVSTPVRPEAGTLILGSPPLLRLLMVRGGVGVFIYFPVCAINDCI